MADVLHASGEELELLSKVLLRVSHWESNEKDGLKCKPLRKTTGKYLGGTE